VTHERPPATETFGQLVRGRMPALDGLRGIAVLLVLAHGFDVIQTSHGPGHAVDLALDLGWIGVQLFFVLSGFLITGILLETRSAPGYYKNFLIRRVLRIFPLYYGVLFVAFVIAPHVVTVPPGHGEHQLWLWTYLTNFAEPFGRGEPVFPHFWSLAVEEQFYIVWPLVVYVAGRRGTVVIGAVLVVTAIAARIYVRAHYNQLAAYTFTPCRMDALAIGAIAAAVIRGDRVRNVIAQRHATSLAIAGSLVVIGGAAVGHLLREGPNMQTTGYTIIAVGFALVVVAAMPPRLLPARLLGFAPLRRIGLYSYGMYVFHAPLHVYVGVPILEHLNPTYGTASGAIYELVMALVTFGLAMLSYHLFEVRFLRLKPTLAPVATPAIAGSGGDA
jgi:peptidoglycan/LPS O-acetylase OafA/YrhL